MTDGSYRYVRHPSYSGLAFVLARIALACDDARGLLVAAVLGGAGLAVRIRAGERQLTQALGAKYERLVCNLLAAGCTCMGTVHLRHPDTGRGDVPVQGSAVAPGPLDPGQADGPEPAQPAR